MTPWQPQQRPAPSVWASQWQPPPPPPSHESKAIWALALGVLSMTCLGFLAGLPAIIVGALARRDIDRAEGRLTGQKLAIAGIVMGLFGTGLSLIGGVALLAHLVGEPQPEDASSSAADAPLAAPPAPPPVAPGTRTYGSLEVVDLDTNRPLRAQLVEIAKPAKSKGRTVMLQTYVRASRECAEVAQALPDARMQRALANVTLVRVDVGAFEQELRAMRVDTESVPWFYTLDAAARPTDAINADEWEENIPENMAPVLHAFVRGRLSARKTPAPLGTSL